MGGFLYCPEKCLKMAKKPLDRKSTRLNSSHLGISYAVFCLKKKKNLNVRLRPEVSSLVCWDSRLPDLELGRHPLRLGATVAARSRRDLAACRRVRAAGSEIQ